MYKIRKMRELRKHKVSLTRKDNIYKEKTFDFELDDLNSDNSDDKMHDELQKLKMDLRDRSQLQKGFDLAKLEDIKANPRNYEYTDERWKKTMKKFLNFRKVVLNQ